MVFQKGNTEASKSYGPQRQVIIRLPEPVYEAMDELAKEIYDTVPAMIRAMVIQRMHNEGRLPSKKEEQ